MFTVDDDRVILGRDNVPRRRFRLKFQQYYTLQYEWHCNVDKEWKIESYQFGDSSPELYGTQERFNVRRCLFFKAIQWVKQNPSSAYLIYSGNVIS